MIMISVKDDDNDDDDDDDHWLDLFLALPLFLCKILCKALGRVKWKGIDTNFKYFSILLRPFLMSSSA